MDLRRKGSIKSYGSNKSLQSGSFDFDQDPDRDADRREVVVKIDADDGPGEGSFSLHAAGGLANVSTGSPSVAPGSASGSSISTSPKSGGIGQSFSFKNRPPQSPTSPEISNPGESTDDPPSRLIGSFLRKQAAAGGEMLLDPDFEMEEPRRPRKARVAAGLAAASAEASEAGRTAAGAAEGTVVGRRGGAAEAMATGMRSDLSPLLLCFGSGERNEE